MRLSPDTDPLGVYRLLYLCKKIKFIALYSSQLKSKLYTLFTRVWFGLDRVKIIYYWVTLIPEVGDPILSQ